MAGGVSIDCAICLEGFKTPKLLPCHHTFCAVCLENYIARTKSGNTFKCPICRKQAEVPAKGVGAFQTNFYIDQEENKRKEKCVQCDICDDASQADHRCLVCEENLCPRCTEVHLKQTATRTHNLLELKSADPNIKRRLKSRVFCTKHPSKEIEVICKQCDQLLCLLCMVTDHQGHRSREVTKEAVDVRQKLKEAAQDQQLQRAMQRQTENVEKLQRRNEVFKRSYDEDLKRLRSQGAKMHNDVEERIKNLEKELKREYVSAIRETNEEINKSKKFRTEIKSITAEATDAQTQLNDVEIIQKGNTLCPRLSLTKIQEPAIVQEGNVDNMGMNLFTVGSLDNSVFSKGIGSVIPFPTCLLRKGEPPIANRLKQESKFTIARAQDICSIAPVSDNRAWLSDYSNKVAFVDVDGKVITFVNVGTRCYSVCAADTDSCLMTCPGDKSIKRATVGGQIEDMISSTDGNPYGLAFRNMFTRREVMFSCDYTSNKGGAVFVAPYVKGAKATPWSIGYTCPWCIASDPTTGLVCVADYGVGKKEVTILDDKGTKLSVYKDDRIEPFGVCFDSQRCIIVTQNTSIQPHRITSNGTLVEILPHVHGRRAAGDTKNRIWVGGQSGQVAVYQI